MFTQVIRIGDCGIVSVSIVSVKWNALSIIFLYHARKDKNRANHAGMQLKTIENLHSRYSSERCLLVLLKVKYCWQSKC